MLIWVKNTHCKYIWTTGETRRKKASRCFFFFFFFFLFVCFVLFYFSVQNRKIIIEFDIHIAE